MVYTKGDWYIWHTNNAGDIIETDERQIAQVVQGNPFKEGDKKEEEANARLIAAAPDMYQALKLAQQVLDSVKTFQGMQIINKALAKAEGVS